jgi:hypothetical protein
MNVTVMICILFYYKLRSFGIVRGSPRLAAQRFFSSDEITEEEMT